MLVFSVKCDDHWVPEAMRAGARGYLLKDADEDDIRRDIQEVAGGSVVFGPSFANRVASWFEPGRSTVRREFPGSPTASTRCGRAWWKASTTRASPGSCT